MVLTTRKALRSRRPRPSKQAWLFLRLLVRTHRSEIMFGVLVIILCPNHVADLRHGRALDTVHSFSARFESSSARGEWHSMSTASSVQQMSLSVLIGAHS